MSKDIRSYFKPINTKVNKIDKMDRMDIDNEYLNDNKKSQSVQPKYIQNKYNNNGNKSQSIPATLYRNNNNGSPNKKYTNYNNLFSNQKNNYSSNNINNNNNKTKCYWLPHKQSFKWKTYFEPKLLQKINNEQELYKMMNDINKSKKNLKGLRIFLKEQNDDEYDIFFEKTLPFIQQICLELPKLFPDCNVILLESGIKNSVELTEYQVCSLLAMSFFGINTWKRPSKYPRFSILNLLSQDTPVIIQKIYCILNYFTQMEKSYYNYNNNNNNDNNGRSQRVIRIYRHVIENNETDIFKHNKLLTNETKLCDFEFNWSDTIEDSVYDIQIDFANKYIGGGVLNHGCVQEEIRFLINTECLISCLLCEVMNDNESISIIGSKRFNKYDGYGSGFEFDGTWNDETKTDIIDNNNGNYIIKNCIVGIDALRFNGYKQVLSQYDKPQIKRELIKAYAGFNIPNKITNLCSNDNDTLSIATGNWGCGVFGGNIELKCLIQWIAATLSNKTIKYYAFEDNGCKYIESFIDIMKQNQVTICELYKHIYKFSTTNKSIYNSIFEYIVSFYPNNSLKISSEYMNNISNDSNDDGYITTDYEATSDVDNK